MNLASASLAVALAGFFVSLGTGKVLAVSSMRQRAADVGYTANVYRGIGALELGRRRRAPGRYRRRPPRNRGRRGPARVARRRGDDARAQPRRAGEDRPRRHRPQRGELRVRGRPVGIGAPRITDINEALTSSSRCAKTWRTSLGLTRFVALPST